MLLLLASVLFQLFFLKILSFFLILISLINAGFPFRRKANYSKVTSFVLDISINLKLFVPKGPGRVLRKKVPLLKNAIDILFLKYGYLVARYSSRWSNLVCLWQNWLSNRAWLYNRRLDSPCWPCHNWLSVTLRKTYNNILRSSVGFCT